MNRDVDREMIHFFGKYDFFLVFFRVSLLYRKNIKKYKEYVHNMANFTNQTTNSYTVNRENRRKQAKLKTLLVSFPSYFKFGAFVSILSFLPWTLGPLSSQPVTVPNLNTPSFNSKEFKPVLDAAENMYNQNDWEYIVSQVKGVLQAKWEQSVDQQIQIEVSNVTQNDSINGSDAYKQYLQSELRIQKEKALKVWMLSAESLIENRRVTYLAANSQRSEDNTLATSQKELSNIPAPIRSRAKAEEFKRALSVLANKKAQYRRNVEAQANQAMADYQRALSQLDLDRESFIAAMNAAEAQFQSQLKQIEALEANVIQGITSSLDNMENYLQSSNQFYVETCDLQNVCSYDTNTLNASGQSLRNLIDDLRTKISNKAPLTAVVTQLQTYLVNQKANAQTERDIWQGKITTSGSWTADQQEVGGVPINSLGYIVVSGFPLNWPAAFAEVSNQINTNPAYATVKAAIAAFDGSPAALEAIIQFDHRTVSVNSVSICGEGNHAVAPLQTGTWSINDCYGGPGTGMDFAVFQADSWVGPPPVPVSSLFAEQRYEVQASWTWTDPNAQNNRDVWQGFMNDLDPMILAWQNDLLPALQTWNAQKATYQANYASWKADAMAQMAEYEKNYQNGKESITNARNSYISRVQTEIKRANRKFNKTRRLILRSEKRGKGAKRLKRIQRRLNRLPGGLRTVSTAKEAYIDAASSQPGLNLNFLNRANQDIPDFKLLGKINQGIQKTLRGALNIAVVSNQSELAQKEQQKANQRLADAFRGTDGPVVASKAVVDAALIKAREKYDEKVKKKWWKYHEPFDEEATRKSITESIEEQMRRQKWDSVQVVDGKIVMRRKMAVGNAVQRAGTFGLSEADFEIPMQDQELSVLGAGAVKLTKTKGLFDDEFDINEVNKNFNDEMGAFYKNLDNVQTNIIDSINNANDILENRLDSANASMENQISFNNTVKQLLEVVVGGGSVGDFVRQQIDGQIAANIEEMTGIPAGLISGMQGNGMDFKSALAGWIEDTAISNLDAMTGLNGAGAWLRESWDKKQKAGRNSLGHKIKRGVVGRVAQSFEDAYADMATNVLGLPPSAVNLMRVSTTIEIAKDIGKSFNSNQLMLNPFTGGILFNSSKFDSTKLKNKLKDKYELDKVGNDLRDFGETVKSGDYFDKMSKLTFADVVNSALGPITKSLGALMSPPFTPPGPGQLQLQDSLADAWADASGWPVAYTKATFSGASMGEAAMAQFYQNIEDQFGIPDLGNALMEHVKKAQFNKEKHKAGRGKIEDVLTLGVTYTWRNEKYNPNLAAAVQVAELAAVAAVSMTGVGAGAAPAMLASILPAGATAAQAAVLAYNVAKQGYNGSLEGGTKGAVAGAATAYATGLIAGADILPPGANLDFQVSYTHDNGWGASINGGMPITGIDGLDGMDLQGSIELQEGKAARVDLHVEGEGKDKPFAETFLYSRQTSQLQSALSTYQNLGNIQKPRDIKNQFNLKNVQKRFEPFATQKFQNIRQVSRDKFAKRDIPGFIQSNARFSIANSYRAANQFMFEINNNTIDSEPDFGSAH